MQCKGETKAKQRKGNAIKARVTGKCARKTKVKESKKKSEKIEVVGGKKARKKRERKARKTSMNHQNREKCECAWDAIITSFF